MKVFPQNQLLSRATLLFCFSLLLLIPLQLIIGIIEERNDLFDTTSENIGLEWGSAQIIAGPVLTIPYSVERIEKETITDENGKKREVEKKVTGYYLKVILPDTLNASVALADEVRKRGIYQSTVYTGKLDLNGRFTFDLAEEIPSGPKVTVYANQAFVSLGLEDTKALMKINEFSIDGKNVELQSGSGLSDLDMFAKGTFGNVKLGDRQTVTLPYKINLEFRGSNSVSIIPLAKDNVIGISSTWKDPSFFGLLPENREVSESGFSASWNISHLVRNYPQSFLKTEYPNLKEAVVGVVLYDNITHYRQVVRAVKYGYLYIALTLMTLFIFEITSRKPTHFIQYAVVGASLIMFYLMLLSFAEHLSFSVAYLISAAAVVLPVSLYTAAIMRDKRYGGGIFLILTGLYLILFSILKMEDYALITGTILITCVLYALMYLTRRLRGGDIYIQPPIDKIEK